MTSLTPPQVTDKPQDPQPPQGLPSETAGAHDEVVSPEARRVLIVATSAFTLAFAVWVTFAIVGLKMRKEFGLSDAQFALLAALPILTGSFLRVPVGILTDRVGGRRTMAALLAITAVPTLLLSQIDTYNQALIAALGIGMAGTTFAAGVAWVSAWYPSTRQGFALGVFGAGNVGASITKLLAPTLVTLVPSAGLLAGFIPGGWRFVPVVYAVALVAMAATVLVAAPRPDHRPAHGRGFAEMSRPLLIARVGRFGFYYVTVFGAYVALALWLPKYYVDVYGLEIGTAGLLTAAFIFPASLLRPFGGALSDRFGPRLVTACSFVLLAATSTALSFPMSVEPFAALVFVLGIAMGIGKASVYTYVPQYFPRDVGAVGGLVGAVGGMGGFVLPLLFAWAKSETHRPQSTFYVLTALAVLSICFLSIAVSRLQASTHQGEL
jgi:NNP family nitrate/nitrite transporter-like MFS transporter